MQQLFHFQCWTYCTGGVHINIVSIIHTYIMRIADLRLWAFVVQLVLFCSFGWRHKSPPLNTHYPCFPMVHLSNSVRQVFFTFSNFTNKFADDFKHIPAPPSSSFSSLFPPSSTSLGPSCCFLTVSFHLSPHVLSLPLLHFPPHVILLSPVSHTVLHFWSGWAVLCLFKQTELCLCVHVCMCNAGKKKQLEN